MDAESANGETFNADEIAYLPPAGTTVCMKLPRTLVGHRQLISFHTCVAEEIDYEAES